MARKQSAGLEASGLTASFGGIKALDGISFTADPGQVYGLIGPNGSGKTTVLNAISGFIKATGTIKLGDTRLDKLPPYRRSVNGLGRSFQNPRLDPSLTVLELLRIGDHLQKHRQWLPLTFNPRRSDHRFRETVKRYEGWLERAGLDASILPEPLTSLSAGTAKMIDVLRAMLSEPLVLLLDEPSSGMNETEIASLREILADLQGQGVTVILVEHHLRFMNEVCDAITALKDGRVIVAGDPKHVLGSREVEEAYLGQALKSEDLSADAVATAEAEKTQV